MTADEIHNLLATDLTKRILRETGCGVDAIIVAESIVFGVLLAQAGERATALEWLATLTLRVEERLPDQLLVPFDAVRAEVCGSLQ